MTAYRPGLHHHWLQAKTKCYWSMQQLCKSCRTCFKFYCVFYFTYDRSLSKLLRAADSVWDPRPKARNTTTTKVKTHKMKVNCCKRRQSQLRSNLQQDLQHLHKSCSPHQHTILCRHLLATCSQSQRTVQSMVSAHWVVSAACWRNSSQMTGITDVAPPISLQVLLQL